MYFCCDSRRRNDVRRARARLGDAAANAIDYVEVLDADAPAAPPGERSLRQRILSLHFLHGGHLEALTPQSFRVEGGERYSGLRVEAVSRPAGGAEHVRELRLDRYGDFSTYTLRLVREAQSSEPPAGFDPMLSAVEFSFKAECPTDFDCEASVRCAPASVRDPEIDYLAKDYASFRRLMLDRMAVLLPQWNPKSPADLGLTLVEALAYVADRLSYEQDAVATEAYLATARRRVSVRRHARLVDYVMHEGCNARTWLHAQVAGSAVPLPAGTRAFAGMSQLPGRIEPDQAPDARTFVDEAVTFESVHDALLFSAHNEIRFYTWSDTRCCLPKGATRATLVDDADATKRLRLRAGDVLVFIEKRGPESGQPADADPTHRHAVRLTRVWPAAEPVWVNGKEADRQAGPRSRDELTGQAIVEIEWAPQDALPFPLLVSTSKDDVSVASGNIVLADHGLSVEAESLGSPAASPLGSASVRRFEPRLARGPLTHALPYDSSVAASATLSGDPAAAFPVITLTSEGGGVPMAWRARRDLLERNHGSAEFVVELDDDAVAQLRFGENKRPAPGMTFTASYRVGNGAAGNVGADAITHIVSTERALLAVTNPLPACGGIEAESVAEVRQRAPQAFRKQERAVTEEDYARMAERDPDVQRAAATFRWTGSWHTAFVTVDQRGGHAVDEGFEHTMRRRLEPVRLLGHDLEVDAPRFVPLEIEMHVCVRPGYFRSHVAAALREKLSNRLLSGGRRGAFHPDNFTFGQTVYLSPLYAAAQAVAGVQSVHVTTFQRLGVADSRALSEGRLVLGRLEIARLDNSANFPERGVFRLNLGGGK